MLRIQCSGVRFQVSGVRCQGIKAKAVKPETLVIVIWNYAYVFSSAR